MPVTVEDLARIGGGQKATTIPVAQKNELQPKQPDNSDVQTVDDLAAIGSGQPLKKKVGSEENTTNTSSGQSTTKISDDAQSDLGTTLAKNAPVATNGNAPKIQFANVPKPLTAQQQLENSGKTIVAKQVQTQKSIDVFNKNYGTDFDPKEVLSNPDKAADFLNLYKSKVAKGEFDIYSKLLASNLIASSESYGQPTRPITPTITPSIDLLSKANLNEQLLTNKVIDLTVGEGKIKGIPQKQVINNLYQRLDPKGYQQMAEAVKDETGVADPYLMPNSPLAKNIELLNTQKAPYEFAVNESLKRQANDMNVMGTLNKDQSLIDGSKSIAAEIQPDDEIYAKYPSLNKARIAADISKEIAEKTGQLKGSDAEGLANNLNKFRGQSDPFNTDAFKKYYANPSTRDAALQVASDPDSYLSDASFLGGIKSNLVKPFKELGYSIGDITGVRDKMDRLADTKNAELFPEITPELKGYVNKIKSAVNTTAYLTGMIALQVPGTALGTSVGLGLKGAERVGTAMAFGIPSFDANLKDADRFMDNDAGKAAYATLGAMINTAGGEFLELGKISKFAELQSPLMELANKMTDKNITVDAVNELLGKARSPYVNTLMKYGTNVGKGAATMSYFTFANGLNKMLFGGNETSKDLIENTGTSFVDGLLGMSVLGAFGAHADLKNEKNTSYKNNIYQLALNHDAARDVIDEAYKNGQYDTPTYNEKVQILNTAIAAKNNLEVAESTNNLNLDQSQRAVYVSNRTAEGIVRKRLESPLLTEEQKGTYEGQLKRLQNQREDILKGLTFSDNLEPLDNIFKAQNEYKKAYEDFNNGAVENDSEVLKSKQKLVDAIEEQKQSQIPEKDREVITTEKPETPSEPIEAEHQKPENDMAGLSHADWFLKNKDKFSDEDFNRINKDLTSNDEALKNKAIQDIVDKKDEVKNTVPTVTEPSTVKMEPTIKELLQLNEVHKNLASQYIEKHNELVKKGFRGDDLNNNPELVAIKSQMDKIENYFKNPDLENKPIQPNEETKTNELPNTQAPEGTTDQSLNSESEATAISRAKELVNSGVVKGFTSDVLKDAANNNIDEFKQHLKEISEQAQDPRSESQTIKTYGKELVDIANKLYPKEDISSQSKINNDGESNGNQEGDSKNGTQKDDQKDNGDNKEKGNDVNTPKESSDKGTASENKDAAPSIEPPKPPETKEPEPQSAEDSKIAIDRKSLSDKVQEQFKKYPDGSSSKHDEEVMDNALKTVENGAKENKIPFNEHLANLVNNTFLEKVNRGDILTDEEKAVMGLRLVDLYDKQKTMSFEANSLADNEKLNNIQANIDLAEYILAKSGESWGRSGRWSQFLFGLKEDGTIDYARKKLSGRIGMDIPTDKDKLEAMKVGLKPNQQKALQIAFDELKKAKVEFDEIKKLKEKLLASQDVKDNQLVLSSIKAEVEKQVKEAIAEYEKNNKDLGKTEKVVDTKGRVIKNKANDIANKLNEAADKLGGNGTAMSSFVAPVQIAAKWVIKGIAEGIRQGGKIPELIEKFMAEFKLKDEFKDADEKDVLSHVKEILQDVGISKEAINALPQRTQLINKISESSKNLNTNDITQDIVAKGLIKQLAAEEARSGTPYKNVLLKVAESLNKNGLDVTEKDVQDAYLKQGKYKLDTEKEIEQKKRSEQQIMNNVVKMTNEINALKGVSTIENRLTNTGEKTNYEKQLASEKAELKKQKRSTEIDAQIREINEKELLFREIKNKSPRAVDEIIQKKNDELNAAMRDKGLRVERGDSETQASLRNVADLHNERVGGIANKVIDYLNADKFGDLTQAQTDMLLGLRKKLSIPTDNANITDRLAKVEENVKSFLSDLGFKKVANDNMREVVKDISDLVPQFNNDKSATIRDITLSRFKQRMKTETEANERNLKNGIYDNTTNVNIVQRDAEAIKLEARKKLTENKLEEGAVRAEREAEPKWLKAVRGFFYVQNKLIIGGIGVLGKLSVSATARLAESVTTRPLAALYGKATGLDKSAASQRFKLDSQWKGIKNTFQNMSEEKAQAITENSTKEYHAALEDFNNAKDELRDLKTKYGIDSKEVSDYKSGAYTDVENKYNVASTNYAASFLYNFISPSAWKGRFKGPESILQTGKSKQEQIFGGESTYPSLEDRLYDESQSQQLNLSGELPSKNWLQRQVKAGVHFLDMWTNLHPVIKDISARKELVNGYLTRLQKAQENGQDISDRNLQLELLHQTYLTDYAEGKYMDANLAAKMVKQIEHAPGDLLEKAGGNKDVAKLVKVVGEGITPVLKVPLNIANEAIFKYNLGVFTGMTHLIKNMVYAKKAGYEGWDGFKDYMATLPPKETDRILECFAKGTIGAALYYLGASMTASGFMKYGGSYEEGKSKKVIGGEQIGYNDIQFGDFKLNHLASRIAEHIPMFYPVIMGNVAAETYLNKSNPDQKHPESTVGAIGDAAYDMAKESWLESPLKSLGKPNEWFSYMGYLGFVNDAEKGVDYIYNKATDESLLEQKGYPDQLNFMESFANRMGLRFLVPSREQAADRKENQEYERKQNNSLPDGFQPTKRKTFLIKIKFYGNN